MPTKSHSGRLVQQGIYFCGRPLPNGDSFDLNTSRFQGLRSGPDCERSFSGCAVVVSRPSRLLCFNNAAVDILSARHENLNGTKVMHLRGSKSCGGQTTKTDCIVMSVTDCDGSFILNLRLESLQCLMDTMANLILCLVK